MLPKILLVDDEPQVLRAYARALKRKFEIDTASGGLEALEKAGHEPFAVVVSDLQMPGMDGITLLEKFTTAHPDTVTMMLTGQADLGQAIAAVNKGHIFRFLTKPCPVETLTAGIEAAVQQYELVQSERILLEQTLKGAIEAMTQTLSLACPDSFSRASRMERMVKAILKRTDLKDHWQFELATSLSQLGTVALPATVLRRLAQGEHLAEVEQRVYQDHPKQGALLLANIPRMEAVRAMVEGQMVPYTKKTGFQLYGGSLGDSERISCGSQLIRITHDFDLAFNRLHCPKKALENLKRHEHSYQPELMKIMGEIVGQQALEQKCLDLKELSQGMILEEDILGRNERLLVKKGQEMTPVVLRFIEKVGLMGSLVTQKVRVSIPVKPEPAKPRAYRR